MLETELDTSRASSSTCAKAKSGRELREQLMEPRLERFIGVVYRPETERWSHYSGAVLPRQFGAWVWFDETSAITPLPGEQRPGDDETYPFGL